MAHLAVTAGETQSVHRGLEHNTRLPTSVSVQSVWRWEAAYQAFWRPYCRPHLAQTIVVVVISILLATSPGTSLHPAIVQTARSRVARERSMVLKVYSERNDKMARRESIVMVMTMRDSGLYVSWLGSNHWHIACNIANILNTRDAQEGLL